MLRVGCIVSKAESANSSKVKTGRVVALSHARNEYLVLWQDGSQSRHTRWVLTVIKPAAV